MNNFDLLRFLLAFSVFMFHAAVLTQVEELQFLLKILSSNVAIQAFFVISGFLIFMSCERSSSLKRYFEKRVRRIYPAYFTIILVSVLLGAFITMSDSYLSLDTVKFMAVNLVFLNFIQHSLPGVFDGNPYSSALNGSLWTLKIEVMFYAVVPILVFFFRRFPKAILASIIYLSSYAYSYVLTGYFDQTHNKFYEVLARQLPGQMSYFISGALLYYYLDTFSENKMRYFTVGIVGYISYLMFNITVVQPISLAIIIIYAAYCLPYFGNFVKYGDFSYGVYIIHFPVLQALLSYGLFGYNPYLAMVISIMIVFMLSALMWHVVEKKFLHKSSHYMSQ